MVSSYTTDLSDKQAIKSDNNSSKNRTKGGVRT